MMKYHLKENWNVNVDIEIKHDGIEYDFGFDFIVNTDEKWIGIINLAKSIIEEKFGHSGYKIKQMRLSGQD